MDTERNLLFAIVAFRGEFISREQFAEACAVHAANKDAPLADFFVRKGWLTADDRKAVEWLLARKLHRHHGDAGDALATSAGDPFVRNSMIATPVSAAGNTAPLPADSAPVPVPPQAAERYAVGAVHATGGMGKVWRARDRQVGREVALKDLRPELLDSDEFRGRFLREARITGQLQHPGVVPVYEIGTQAGGEPFYVMRFVRGRTLAQAARDYHRDRKPLELHDLLTAFVAVCQTIEYAHSEKVIHRDLKPANVILGPYGETLVLDWGLARKEGEKDAQISVSWAAGADAALVTVPGTVMGTPAYAAPEQAAGQIDRLGPATDVYGLGAILYEILTGKPPFTGDVATVLELVKNQPPAPPRSLVRDVPRPLEAVCLKALAKAPAARHASAAALGDDVRRFLADEPVSAYSEPLSARLRRKARRNPRAVAVLLTLLLVLFVATSGAWYWRLRSEAEAGRQRERLRVEAEQRHAAGLEAAHAGDVDRAVTALTEAAGTCRRDASLAGRGEQIAGQIEQLERYRRFEALAAAALRDGVHNVRGRVKPDPVLLRCEEVLTILADVGDDWRTAHDDGSLNARQVEQAKRKTNEVLILTALRLAMHEGDEASTRRALGLLDRAAALEPPSAGIWMMRMLWHRRLKQHAEAEAAGEQTVRLAKEGGMKSARDYYLLGSVLLHLGKGPQRQKQREEALPLYRAALKLEPNHYGALFGSYLCYEETKDHRAQLAPLTACLALRPGDADLHAFRGIAHFHLQEYDQAFDDFDAALRSDPKHALASYWRGRSRVMANRWAEAEKDFDRATGLDATNRNALLWRAVARSKIDRHREAADDADRAVEREPKDPSTLILAARAHAQAVRAVMADLNEPNRAALARRYGDRAVERAERAIRNGFTDLERLGPGGDFDPVRERTDFQRLLRKPP